MNQVLMFRLMAVSLSVASGFFVAGLCVTPRLDGAGADGAREDLLALLQRLRTAPDQQAHARILRDGRREGRAGLSALREILGEEDHRLRQQAVECAGALGLAELRPDVVPCVASGSPELRAAAARSVERLGPWTRAELVDLLGSDVAPLQVAVLEIASERSDAPWAEMLQLLGSKHSTVQRAAMRSLPQQLSPDAVVALRAVLEHDEAGVAIAALGALRRARIVEALEAEVVALAGDRDPLVQSAALDCLASKGAPLEQAGPVRDLVTDSSAPRAVRTRALYCLERTATGLGELDAKVRTLDPVVQYFAARCWAAAGRVEGTDLLLELAARSGVASAGSRKLLSALTGLNPASSVEAFGRSLQENPHQLGALPPPGVDF